MAMHMAQHDDFDEDAPRPVDANSVKNGAFEHLEEGQGAVSAASHRTADATSGKSEPEPMSKRTMAIIVAGALVVIVIVVVLFVRILDAPTSNGDKNAELEQTAVEADQSITSRGASYELAEADGKYQLMEMRDGGSVSLGDITGVPVNLVLYDGALIIPENLSDGTWDVLAYTIGSGWSQIMDQDGNAIAGTGTISEAQLEGSTVVLTVDGQRVEVPLVW